ncbi:tRNA (adenosine(37)-N6)-threonylcarbamoyltransferase complex ATPase subunit type 1 TsaE [Flavobacterium sp.]|uniref:tRNA (adenosine(37)-N6)-threonylcarbamoyltransferase complex ATPase subunit type 1 TsaE n=1 Tax=Flavobacterium sp. TaxID=239 RepID=UPI00286BAFD5|nr:tRNA (adenosine(37)-N6)-threonylcarbamoyltransferase complex ATPase subunit type 1 TsaE [Flavobacterium sp.]
MEFIFSLNEINQVAKKIIASNPQKVILFNGEMGAGKTTLIKFLSKELGINSNISSPTFSLVNEYQITANQLVYHFDFYRLKNQSEALDMGVEDYLYSGHWCFIEWAENIKDLIPENHSRLTISILEDGKRQIVLQ